MFDYDFMRYAFIAGIFIALISCVMGVFVVARQTSFFTHTLSEIGFSGAAYYLIAISISYAVSGYYSLYKDQTIVYSKYKARYINRKTR